MIQNVYPSLCNTHILVAPRGTRTENGTVWNVFHENVRVDDVGFISELINYLSSFENVMQDFRLLGVSNGAALVNRILVENDNTIITHAITDSSQLMYELYHKDSTGNEKFWLPDENNRFTIPKTYLKRRRILQLTGEYDTIVPSIGGNSRVASLYFYPWTYSLFAFAKGFGYEGLENASYESPAFRSVGYMNSTLQAFDMKRVGHVVLPFFPNIHDFLLYPEKKTLIYENHIVKKNEIIQQSVLIVLLFMTCITNCLKTR